MEQTETERVPLIEYVKVRMDSQDTQLETIARDVRAVHKQATKTNGRVTELEKQASINEALQESFRSRVANRKWGINLAAGCTCMIVGGALGEITRVFH